LQTFGRTQLAARPFGVVPKFRDPRPHLDCGPLKAKGFQLNLRAGPFWGRNTHRGNQGGCRSILEGGNDVQARFGSRFAQSRCLVGSRFGFRCRCLQATLRRKLLWKKHYVPEQLHAPLRQRRSALINRRPPQLAASSLRAWLASYFRISCPNSNFCSVLLFDTPSRRLESQQCSSSSRNPAAPCIAIAAA